MKKKKRKEKSPAKRHQRHNNNYRKYAKLKNFVNSSEKPILNIPDLNKIPQSLQIKNKGLSKTIIVQKRKIENLENEIRKLHHLQQYYPQHSETIIEEETDANSAATPRYQNPLINENIGSQTERVHENVKLREKLKKSKTQQNFFKGKMDIRNCRSEEMVLIESNKVGENIKTFLSENKGSGFVSSLLFSPASQNEILNQIGSLLAFLESKKSLEEQILHPIKFTLKSITQKVTNFQSQLEKLYYYQEEIIEDLRDKVQILNKRNESLENESRAIEKKMNERLFEAMCQCQDLIKEKETLTAKLKKVKTAYKKQLNKMAENEGQVYNFMLASPRGTDSNSNTRTVGDMDNTAFSTHSPKGTDQSSNSLFSVKKNPL